MSRREEVGIDILARDLASREFKAASAAINEMGKEASGLDKVFGKVNSAIMGFFQGLGQQVFMKAQQALAMLGDMAIGFNAKMEQAKIGFTTMLGSAQKANAFIAELLEFSKRTPFQFEGLQKSANLIMAMGFAAEEVIPLLTAAGDAVAALGAGEDAVFRVVYALGQMRAAGRVTGQDMMQLASIGIPAWKMLADAMGVTVQQAKMLAEQGKISAEEAIAAITNAIESGNMGGMMEAQAKTFNGALSTIKDTVTILVSSAFKPFFDMLSQGANSLATFLSTEKVERFGQTIADVMRKAGGAVVSLMGAALPVLELLVRQFDALMMMVPVVAAMIGVQLVQSLLKAIAAAGGLGAALGKLKWVGIAVAIPMIGEVADQLTLAILQTQGLTRAQSVLAVSLSRTAGLGADSLNKVIELADRLGVNWEDLAQRIIDANNETGISFEEYVARFEGSAASMSEEWGQAWLDMGQISDEAWGRMTGQVVDSTAVIEEELDASMKAMVESMMQAAREVPGGMALTLEDGTTIFAASADALAQKLPEKIRQANIDAILEARTAPGRLGGAILDSISEWDDVGDQIAAAWADALAPSVAVSNAMGLLMSGNLQAAIATGNQGLITEIGGLYQSALTTLNTYGPQFTQAGADVPQALTDGIISTLQLLADGGDAAAAAMLGSFLIAENQEARRRAGGTSVQNITEGVDAGVTANEPAVDADLRRLLTPPAGAALQWGTPIGKEWLGGVIAGVNSLIPNLYTTMDKIKRIMMGESPPKEGPLHTIDIGGENVGKAWMLGIRAGIREHLYDVQQIAGQIFPNVAPATGSLGLAGLPNMVGNLGGGGVTITIINQFGANSVRSDEDIRDISRQTAERVRLLGSDLGLAQGQVGVVA